MAKQGIETTATVRNAEITVISTGCFYVRLLSFLFYHYKKQVHKRTCFFAEFSTLFFDGQLCFPAIYSAA